MSNFELTVLGANSALPAYNRFPTSQVLQFEDSLFLIDCGEGTQIKLSQHKIKRSRINHIFISHLHGDHILGLPGLLNSYSLNGRTEPLHIYSPAGLQEIIDTIFEYSQARSSYDIVYTTLDPQNLQKLVSFDGLTVYTFPLQHRITTAGFLFKEKRTTYKIRPEAISELNLSIDQIKEVKKGKNIVVDNREINYEDITISPPPLRSYAYCSDTVYDDSIVPYIKDCSLLYHEATYLDDMRVQAKERMHSTTKEAGMIAKLAGVQKLVIGHYSSRYKDLSPLEQEAREVFANTDLAIEGQRYPV